MIRRAKNLIKYTRWYQAFQRLRPGGKNQIRHEQDMLVLYSHFILPGDLCFDVGANIGDRVQTFLKLQARVVAVEPQSECVRILQRRFGSHPNLTIFPGALGEAEGEAEIMISNISTLSSMSPAWIEAVKKSGRFSQYQWDKKAVVPMTTLDALLQQYGTPSFIKIDVEGFEYPVLQGLSQPVKTISLEFVPEIIEPTFHCIEHLHSLGDIRLNHSIGETMQLALRQWVTPREMIDILSGYRDHAELFGDVYVKFQG